MGLIFIAACIAVLLIAAVSIAGTGIAGAPWLPTPVNELEKILAEADLKPGEVFVDIGCGDGRTLIAAARGFGARGIGIELDPLKALIARLRVRRAGFSGRIRIIRTSAMRAPLHEADVVFLYLSHQLIDRLKPKFLGELKPGARIISYGFMVSGFPLMKTDGARKWFLYRMSVGRIVNKYS